MDGEKLFFFSFFFFFLSIGFFFRVCYTYIHTYICERLLCFLFYISHLFRKGPLLSPLRHTAFDVIDREMEWDGMASVGDYVREEEKGREGGRKVGFVFNGRVV